MNFVEKITGTIKNPKNTMDSIAEQPMIEDAVMIVGIYAVLGALSAIVMADRITYVFEGMENMPPSMQTITTIAGIVGALVAAFFVWVASTGIIHLISMALGGEGKFYPQMMTVIGFSMIPLLFGSVIGLVLLFMVEPMTITVSMADPLAATEITKELFDNPYLLTSSIIGILMQIWTAIIIFFGLQSAHRLTPGKSAVAAGIPLVIIILYSAWSSGIL